MYRTTDYILAINTDTLFDNNMIPAGSAVLLSDCSITDVVVTLLLTSQRI